MRKTFIIAATSFAALLSCTKYEQSQNNGEDGSFQKGQQVTFCVTAGEFATKLASSLNSDGTTVDFKWQKGDKIKVTIGDKSSEFTLAAGAGESTAIFTGTMPASGSSFDVQYPVTEPTITTQTYSSTEALPHDKVLFKNTGCTLGSSSFSLYPQYAVLRLNLYGTDQTVSKIVVTNESTTDTYTLNISPAATLSTSSSDPTPFFIVVPAGSYIFSAEVIYEASSLATPPADAIQNGVFTVSGTTDVFTTSTANTFTAGQFLDMPAKEISVTLLKKVYFSKGNLYYDRYFKFEDTQYSYHSGSGIPTGLFCWVNNSGSLSKDILSALPVNVSFYLSGSTGDVFFTNATQTTPRADFTVDGETGKWRTLSGGDSGGEWDYLLNSRPGVTIGSTTGCRYAKVKVNSTWGLLIFPDTFTWPSGVSSKPSTFNTYPHDESCGNVNYTVTEFSLLESAGCVFLPAAGCWNVERYMVGDGSIGSYWSSRPASLTNWDAYLLSFDGDNQYWDDDLQSWRSDYTVHSWLGLRGCGRTVRLVCSAQ